MNWLTILGIAIALAMDAFAVSVAYGCILSTKDHSAKLKLSLSFGLFQGIMPILGWFLANYFKYLVEAYDHWIAFGLLSIIGLKMLKDSFSSHDNKLEKILNWKIILILSIATSIDALAVGLSFSVLNQSIFIAASVIAITTALLSLLGLELGRKFNDVLGHKAEITGGIILIGLGFKILMEHIKL